MAADDSENDKLVAPADFDGPIERRHCTDLLFLLLLICMWVAMTGVGIHAVTEGDYRLVLYPLDYDGNICGTDFAEDMVRATTAIVQKVRDASRIRPSSTPTLHQHQHLFLSHTHT
jgi:hypothetical protein